jgi:hypothetical protein
MCYWVYRLEDQSDTAGFPIWYREPIIRYSFAKVVVIAALQANGYFDKTSADYESELTNRWYPRHHHSMLRLESVITGRAGKKYVIPLTSISSQPRPFTFASSSIDMT